MLRPLCLSLKALSKPDQSSETKKPSKLTTLLTPSHFDPQCKNSWFPSLWDYTHCHTKLWQEVCKVGFGLVLNSQRTAQWLSLSIKAGWPAGLARLIMGQATLVLQTLQSLPASVSPDWEKGKEKSPSCPISQKLTRDSTVKCWLTHQDPVSSCKVLKLTCSKAALPFSTSIHASSNREKKNKKKTQLLIFLTGMRDSHLRGHFFQKETIIKFYEKQPLYTRLIQFRL